MSELLGSKYVKFGKIFRAPFQSSNLGLFNGDYEDPTYLTFKVEFGGWGRSQKELLNANVYVDDAESNNIWDANFDDYPMGLFDMNFNIPIDGYDADYYQKTDTYGTVRRYNAVNWLYTRHEDMRAEYLKTFINGINSLQTYTPYFITSVSGVDSLLDFNVERGARVKNDAKLTFTFNDSIDQRVRTLFELYRKAAWDDEYQRWVLPENLREFKMILYISEVRDFHRPNTNEETNSNSNIIKRAINTLSELFSNWVFSKGEYAVEYNDNNIAPVYAFECYPCQFVIEPLFESEYKSSTEGNDSQIKVSVKVKNVRTYMRNTVINKIENFIISDQLSIYKRFFGSARNEYSYIDAPYKSWLRRDFFTNLYANAGGDEETFVKTYGTNGKIGDMAKLSVHNENLFEQLAQASDLGGLLNANIRRLFGETDKELLLQNYSFSEYIEQYILSSLYDNLKRLALLNDGLKVDSVISQYLMNDMMRNWHNVLSKMNINDAKYLDEIEKGLGMLMSKLENNHEMLENIYKDGVDAIARLNEQRTSLIHGAKPEGEELNLDFIETYLIPNNDKSEFQDAPIDDTSVEMQFVNNELDKTTPELQFNSAKLDNPELNLEFQDAPLENTSLDLKFNAAQLDLTSPELIFSKVELEEPELSLQFQDAPLDDNEVNLQFSAAELEGVEPSLKLQAAELEGVEPSLKLQAAELEGVEPSLKLNPAELEETENNIKFNPAKIEEVENNVKLKDIRLEETETSLKLNPTELEETETSLKLNPTELEETENNIKFNPTKIEEVENNVKLKDVRLEETETSLKLNPTELEETENNIKFNPTKIEEVENNVKLKDVRLEETDNAQNFVDTKLEDSAYNPKFVDQELVDTAYTAELNKVALQETENKIQFKKVQIENLNEYLVQLKEKIEELKKYKAIIEDDKENGNGTKIKTLDLLNNVIDANIEAEKNLQSAKLIINDMDNIETHSIKMNDAELEKPASKQNIIMSGGLIDDYEPNNEIQPIDEVLQFKDKFRRGMRRSENKD